MSSTFKANPSSLSSRSNLWGRYGLQLVGALVLTTAMIGAFGIVWLYQSERETVRCHEIASHLAAVLSLEVDAETAQRGFVITGRDSYLAPYQVALPKIAGELSAAAALMPVDDAQRGQIAELQSVLEQKEAELALVIATRRSAGFGAAQTIINQGGGKQLMDHARELVAEMIDAAAKRLAGRQSHARAVRDSAILAVCTSSGLTVLLLVLFGTSTRRAFRMRMRAAEQVADQKDLLQTTIQSIGDGVVVTSADGRVLVLNAVAQALTKWEESAALGRRVEDVAELRHKSAARLFENPVMPALRGRREISLPAETVLIARDGTEIHVEGSCAPIIDAQGQVRGCVMVFRDITARHQFEDELRASDRRKSEFIATLSHELRNPLAAVRSALDVVRGRVEGKSVPDDLFGLMDRQMRHMVRMIDDLLDVARLSRGTLQVQLAVVDVWRVVRDAIDMVQPLLTRREHRLVVAVPEGELYVLADCARLAQVISNLLTNAAKYSAPGSEIVVTAAGEDRTVVISVRDAGKGLSPESIDSIFNVFVQVQPAAHEMKEGLGIGLSLARQIVSLHQGKIEARSAGVGKGSEFVIRLAGRDPIVSEEPANVAAPDSARVDRQSVLVADDNEDAADALATVLRMNGFEVTVAYNGLEATQLANRLQPDAILLDIGMPGMSGYEVARAIRDAAWAKRATLIAVTGWGQEEDRKQAAAAGFDMHFTKPVDPGVLQQAIVKAGALPDGSRHNEDA